jgi:hypothetical protein
VITLTDEQHSMLDTFATPIPLPLRDAYLQAVARRLAGVEYVTGFAVRTACVEAQREVLNPPRASALPWR